MKNTVRTDEGREFTAKDGKVYVFKKDSQDLIVWAEKKISTFIL